MKITLPWPASKLSPNARLFWAIKSREVKKARSDAAYIAYAAMQGGVKEFRRAFSGDDKIAVKVAFYPPDRRHRDTDNMVASLKSAMDGIADALGVNDRRFLPTYTFHDFDGAGRVEVTINPSSIPKFGAQTQKDSCTVNREGQEQKRAGRVGKHSNPALPNSLSRSEFDAV